MPPNKTPELEVNIENRIVKYVEAIGGLALKLVLASERGFPDRTLLLPGGLVVFIEIKRPNKSTTYPMQRVWQERLQRRGFRCEFVTSLDDVKAIIVEEQARAGNVERWRAVVGYEGAYEVSSIGRVRSLDREQIDTRGKLKGRKRIRKGKVLKLLLQNTGYYAVSLWDEGKVKLRTVHRLVLAAFTGPSPNGHVSRHLDGCSVNNETTNLCWGTIKENIHDQIRHGTKHRRSVERSDGVIFESLTLAAKASDISVGQIARVCQGQNKTSGGYGWEYIT